MSNLSCSNEEYEVMYEKYGKMIHMFAKKYIRSCTGNDYEDLVQEGIITMLKAKKMYNKNKKTSFSTYLYTAIRRRFNKISQISSLENKKRLVVSQKARNKESRKFVSSEYENSLKMSNDKDLCIMLKEEIKKIPEVDRMIIEMKAEGRTYLEIGKKLNLSAQYIKVKQTKILEKIKRKLIKN